MLPKKKKKNKTAVSMIHRLHSGRWILLVFFFSSSLIIYLHDSTGETVVHLHNYCTMYFTSTISIKYNEYKI